MINGQIENIKPMSKKEISKLTKKTTNLSQVFYIPEYPKHISNGNGFNPPRCAKCDCITGWDGDLNLCDDCHDKDTYIVNVKDDLTLQLEFSEKSREREGILLEEIASLFSQYTFPGIENKESILKKK